MPLQNKQAYFDFLLKIDGRQKDLSAYYFLSLNTLEMMKREFAVRQITLIQVSSNLPMGNGAGGVSPVDQVQLVRSLEEQQKELALMQDQVKKATDARKALIDSLSKEQATKIKPYLDAKVY